MYHYAEPIGPVEPAAISDLNWILALQVLPRVDPKNQENVVLGLLLVPASTQNGENEDDQRCLKHHVIYRIILKTKT